MDDGATLKDREDMKGEKEGKERNPQFCFVHASSEVSTKNPERV